MKTLNEAQKTFLNNYVKQNPDKARKDLKELEEAGYDVEGIEAPFSYTQELAAFMGGLPEGASYGLIDADETGQGATTFDVPVLGEVSPSREAGRLLGGMASGGTLWSLGRSLLGTAGKKAATGALSRMGASAPAAQRAGRVGEVAGAATPEAIVGSFAEGAREGSWEAALSALPEWYTLGVGSELGIRKLQKIWNKRRAGQEITSQERQEAINALEKQRQQAINQRKKKDEKNRLDELERFEDEALKQGDVDAMPPDDQNLRSTERQDEPMSDEYLQSVSDDIGGDRPSPDEVIKRLEDVDRPIKAEQIALDTRPTPNKAYFKTDTGDILALDPSDPRTSYLNGLDSQIDKLTKKLQGKWVSGKKELFERQRASLVATKRKAISSGGPPNGDGYHRGMPKKYRDLHPQEQAVQIQGDEMLVDYNRLSGFWKQGTNKTLGIHESTFETFDDFLNFMQEARWLKEVMPFEEWKDILYKPKADVTPSKAYDNFIFREARRKLTTRETPVQKTVAAEPKPSPSEALPFMEDIPQSQLREAEQIANEATPIWQQENKYKEEVANKLGLFEYDGSKVAKGDLLRITNRGGRSEDVTVLLNAEDHWVVETKNGKKSKRLKANWTPQGMMPPMGGGGLDTPGSNVTASYDQRIDILEKVMRLGKYGDKGLSSRMLPEGMTFQQAQEVIEDLDDRLFLYRTRETDEFVDIQDAVNSGKPHVSGARLDRPPDIEVSAALENMPLEDIARQGGIVKNFVSPSSVFGIGKNKFVKDYLVDYTLTEHETMQSVQEAMLNKYSTIRKLVGLPEKVTLNEMVETKIARARGGQSKYDEARQKLFKIARALDTKYDPVSRPVFSIPDDWDKNMQQAYALYRELTTDVANHLGLAQGKRVKDYIHRIFMGKAGSLVAQQMARSTSLFSSEQAKQLLEMGKVFGQLGRVSDDVLEEELAKAGQKVKPRGYRGLLDREGAQDYTYDLDALTMQMIFGSTQRVFSEKVARRTHDVLANLPMHDIKGRINTMPNDVAKFARHVTGRSTTSREKVANFWADHKSFNRGVDRIVEFIGAAPSKGIMQKARMHDPTSGYSSFPEEREMAINWLDDLALQAQDVDFKTGEITGNKNKRAKLALKINDMRDALSNPDLSGPVANAVYRTMIVSKLGINLAHGLTNLTQTLVNVWPLLSKGYTSKGVQDYIFSKSATINGRTAEDLLTESGIKRDITSTEEFMGVLPSGWKALSDKALVFSKSSEELNRGVALLAKYRHAVDQGMSHGSAMNEAQKFVEKTQFSFNRVGTPPVLRGPLMRLIFMFKSYPMHQTDFTATIMKDAWGSYKGARSEGASFAEALANDDVAAMAKHLTAYMALVGGGMAFLPETNFAERNLPPAPQMGYEFMTGMGRYGAMGSAMNVAGGPAGDTATHLGRATVDYLDYIASLLDLSETSSRDALDRAEKNIGKFAGSLTPTLIRKAYEQGTDPELLEMFSLKKYEPKRRGGNPAMGLPPLNLNDL